jgi:methionine-S-sulfoxide reductase
MRQDWNGQMKRYGLMTIAAVALATAGLVAMKPAMTTTAVASETEKLPPSRVQVPEGLDVATFATGCFWCTESDFDKVDGVVTTTSGFIGGKERNPTYRQVVSGATGHTEALQIFFDPKKVTYRQLVEHFWKTTDVLDLDGQFCDRGQSYRPEIFTHSAEQARIANASRDALNASGKLDQEVKVPITPASEFTPAEDYHQDFYRKNPWHYHRYRRGCGRDARLRELWGSDAKS